MKAEQISGVAFDSWIFIIGQFYAQCGPETGNYSASCQFKPPQFPRTPYFLDDTSFFFDTSERMFSEMCSGSQSLKNVKLKMFFDPKPLHVNSTHSACEWASLCDCFEQVQSIFTSNQRHKQRSLKLFEKQKCCHKRSKGHLLIQGRHSRSGEVHLLLYFVIHTVGYLCGKSIYRIDA